MAEYEWLSERAQRMLGRGTRYAHPRDRAEIEAAIERANVPVFEPIVRFAERYGGVEYRVRGRQVDVRHPVHLSLLWPWSESGSGTMTVTPPGTATSTTTSSA